MRKVLLIFGIMVFVLFACAPMPSAQSPIYTPYKTEQVATHIAGTIFVRETNTALSKPTSTSVPPSFTNTPPFSTPTFISAPLPRDLTVTYIVEDELWAWKQNTSQLLLQGENIFAPQISDDGQWVLFRKRTRPSDWSIRPFEELWVVRTDGSELNRLLGPDDLVALTGDEAALFIYDVDWIPGSHKILFNTEKVIQGPPGSIPLFDLYSLELSGEATQLVEAGSGGKFYISPTGTHVALTTNSRIAVLDLENNKQRTLFEFEPLLIPTEGTFTTRVSWDSQGLFLMTVIHPSKMYYSDYAGEPTQVWRLFVNGQTELITEFQPFIPHTGVIFSPDLQYFFYLYPGNSCVKSGMLTLYDIASGEGYPLFCSHRLPQWVPDNEHFIYSLETWQLGSISDDSNQVLDMLNVPTNPQFRVPPHLTWIDDEYFLLVLPSIDVCTINVATLEGIISEIASTQLSACTQDIAFSLPK